MIIKNKLCPLALVLTTTMKRLNIKIYSFHYESYSLDIYIERDKDSVPYQQTETSDRCKEVAREAPERGNSPRWPTSIADITCILYCSTPTGALPSKTLWGNWISQVLFSVRQFHNNRNLVFCVNFRLLNLLCFGYFIKSLWCLDERWNIPFCALILPAF